jgi:hypothetical protein
MERSSGNDAIRQVGYLYAIHMPHRLGDVLI